MKNIELSAADPVGASPVEPLLYDISQVATVLNTSTKTVRRMVLLGRLTRLNGIRKVLIPRKQIEEFIKANCDQPQAAR